MYDKQFLWVNTETAVRLKNKAGPMRCLGGGDSLSVEKVRRCESLWWLEWSCDGGVVCLWSGVKPGYSRWVIDWEFSSGGSWADWPPSAATTGEAGHHHSSPRPPRLQLHLQDQDWAGRLSRGEVCRWSEVGETCRAPLAVCGLIGKFAWTTVRSLRAKLEQTSLDLDLYTTRAVSCPRTHHHRCQTFSRGKLFLNN